MKVLFAVNNEEISESIVKKYQKEYKQIISYKNVYYFNAILKELQKNKSYDRIVISEELEAFTHTQYDQIDKFIFDKLDSISDEASDFKGNDIPIIVIASDRRAKSEQILVKFFGIGIYNAILGTDRSVEEVCKLINRPRVKKEAKAYYKIDSDDVNYQSENENDVSEMEIQNIVAHYKRLGKNEDRYLDSFNNIAAQYNDTQLRVIAKFLPLNVRAVLEEKSPKYQQVMSFNNKISNNLKKQGKEEEGTSGTLLKLANKEKIMTKPVVIPSAVDMSKGKKLSKAKPVIQQQNQQVQEVDDIDDIMGELEEIQPKEINVQNIQQTVTPTPKIVPVNIEEPIIEGLDFDIEEEVEEIIEQPVKRGRGRPRKTPVKETVQTGEKRRRGRPRKNPVPVIEEEDTILNFEEFDLDSNKVQQNNNTVVNQDDFLPGFDEIDEISENDNVSNVKEEINTINQTSGFLPGFDNEEIDKTNNKEDGVSSFLPGFDDIEENEEPMVRTSFNNTNSNNQNQIVNNFDNREQVVEETYETTIDLSNLLTPDKKIATFVGTSKNGTSFIVNNLAELMSSVGVNTAILDTTKNRNSYYIYTKNEEELRNVAENSINGLAQGVTNGIAVNNNLTVYTSLPDEGESVKNVDRVLETLIKKHSLVLIDTDFNTPVGYFKQAQENYLVQTMDILTIQPLTSFLRDLKAKNIIEQEKLKVILNKKVKIRGIRDETIVGGMAFYNDPAMSFMTELFDRDRIKYVSIPYEEETYIKYLEGVIECEISLKGYSKIFIQTLKELGNMVYPIISAKSNSGYRPPTARGNDSDGFSANMNNTLNRMKRNY